MRSLPILGMAPEWDVTDWLGPAPPATTWAGLRGQVVLLEAFQMLCPGCVNHGLPLANKVAASFAAEVTVIGLHTVFEHHEAMQPVSLKAFLHEYRIGFPVGVDRPGGSQGRGMPVTMERYAIEGTPTMLLIDRAGQLRTQAFGKVDELALGMVLGGLIAEDWAPDQEAAQELGHEADREVDLDREQDIDPSESPLG